MNEIAKRETFTLEPRNIVEANEFAKLIAGSEMVPRDYRGKPANVLVAICMGREIGLSPMQSLQNIAIINGKPCLYGDAMLALCLAHHTCEDIIESVESGMATCDVRRRGRAPLVRTFSVEDAKRAGLWGKQGPWTQYPNRMLQMRARAFALRDAFADVLRGLSMVEEVRDIPSERPQRQTTAPVPAPAPDVIDVAAGDPDLEPESEPEPQASEPKPQPTLASILEAIKSAADESALAKVAGPAAKLSLEERAEARAAFRKRAAALKAAALKAAAAQAQTEPPWDTVAADVSSESGWRMREPGEEG